ncbi:MAG: redoxin domain-containing protein [Phycisphaerae bacterium]|jgi:cytochrome c biogenesis protein CcmG/thiol:disulfide interchange protein DsbE|nr:redoxin domain-containing protein [Phycisphaerae bacterium]
MSIRLPFVRPLLAVAFVTATLGISALATSAPKPTFQSGGKTKEDRAAEKAEREKEKAEKERARERSKWMDKLEKEDRAAIDANLEFALPAWTSGLDWVGEAKAPSFDEMRGRVIVIQTFTTKGSGGKSSLDRLAKALEEYETKDVQIIAIHTPEGSDKAEAQLEKSDYAFPVAIDRDGAFCDVIGAYKKPVNLVVNRTGDVKYTGLTSDGMAKAVKELAAEVFDPATKPNTRTPTTSKSPKSFPTYRDAVGSALDLRGKPAPAMGRVDWWNGAPNIQNKLVIVDFWATWCGPCKKAIPHMNEIANAFRADIQCMGISDESNSKFVQGLKDSKLDKGDFAYPVGVDPTGSMKQGFSIGGIPHVVVISADGIVRWQGHPMNLSRDTLTELVEANRAVVAIRGEGNNDRWRRTLDGEKDHSSSSREKSRG